MCALLSYSYFLAYFTSKPKKHNYNRVLKDPTVAIHYSDKGTERTGETGSGQ